MGRGVAVVCANGEGVVLDEVWTGERCAVVAQVCSGEGHAVGAEGDGTGAVQ